MVLFVGRNNRALCHRRTELKNTKFETSFCQSQRSKNMRMYMVASKISRNSPVQLTGFRGCNLQELLLWIKTSFVALGMRPEDNAPENGERTFGFSVSTMLLHTGQRFLSRAQYENTGASPILSWPGCIWFLPVP